MLRSWSLNSVLKDKDKCNKNSLASSGNFEFFYIIFIAILTHADSNDVSDYVLMGIWAFLTTSWWMLETMCGSRVVSTAARHAILSQFENNFRLYLFVFNLLTFLRADLIGHGHPTLFGSQGLDDNALLGQPLKGHPCSISILFNNGILHS